MTDPKHASAAQWPLRLLVDVELADLAPEVTRWLDPAVPLDPAALRFIHDPRPWPLMSSLMLLIGGIIVHGAGGGLVRGESVKFNAIALAIMGAPIVLGSAYGIVRYVRARTPGDARRGLHVFRDGILRWDGRRATWIPRGAVVEIERRRDDQTKVVHKVVVAAEGARSIEVRLPGGSPELRRWVTTGDLPGEG